MNANLIATQKMAATAAGQEDGNPSQGCELNGHEHDRETIVALGSDSLDRRGADARLRGKHVIEAAYPQNIGIAAESVDDPPVAHHIIDDDETAPAR